MVSMVRLALLAALLALAVPSVQAAAQGLPEFNRDNAVASSVIRSGGYELILPDGTKVVLADVGVVERTQLDCLVHLPSLSRQIERGLRTGGLRPIGTAAQQVTLQVRQDPSTGELWCAGAGTGCTIVIASIIAP